ncbi:DUF6273 domain-containing protein [Succinimonas amylolytica]|uniref:DUF6273 domain-containing protein n=1 Tax=Succinimonas amylolytica TaxID=83769 RepID=UPI0023A90FC2
MSETKVNSSWLDKLKGTRVNTGMADIPNLAGKTLEDFHIDRKMDLSSGEADIYLCTGTGKRAGKQYVLKYYRRENAVKQDVVRKLMGIKSPCVAPIVSFGTFAKHQYTVLPYYEMPALSELLARGVRFSEKELCTRIIPSVIAGLRTVHNAGILHRDLKPGNLIPDPTGEHIVLIDFGISSNAGRNTFVVTETGMTPFYAAPEAMQGIFHRETDYYALGITVFELFTGFTPFQNPGLSGEEAARLAAVSKISFPKRFPERLRKLVLGLTYKDISHRNEKNNPNRRWGYDEVARWLKGEDVPVPGEGFSGASKVPPPAVPAFPPYRFNGTACRTEKELIRALLANPEQGIRDLGRGVLTHHYFAVNDKKGELCEKAEKLIELSNDKVRDFVDFLFRLAPDFDGFGRAVFGNREYEFQNAEAFLSYIEGLKSDGNYYEILLLFRRYRNSLKAVSGRVWPSGAYRRLEELATPLIQFGDRIFSDDGAFAAYLEELMAANKHTPFNLKNFVDERRSILEKLKGRPALAGVIARLEKFGSLKEPVNAVIAVNGISYPGIPVSEEEFLKFGSYPQGAQGQKAPIEWLVLDVLGNEALLVSRYGLDRRQYHHESVDITWENCDLRKWLNNDFLKTAFSGEEAKRIKVSEVRNEDNPKHDTRGGNTTRDWVFCLSIAEVLQYFQSQNARRCQATDYARNQGALTDNSNDQFVSWWLRSPGGNQSCASCLKPVGKINQNGYCVSLIDRVVRPALRLILNL